MELSRRDAVAALATLGLAASTTHIPRPNDLSPRTIDTIETLTATAHVIYPTEISEIEPFVETYTSHRLTQDEWHASGVQSAVDTLDTHAHAWYDARFSALTLEDREQLLRELGLETADENPTGTTAERLRYFIIDDLLLALYASPTGGDLVGLDNPQGHPGGLTSYRRPP